MFESLGDADRPKCLSEELFARIKRVYGPYARPLLDQIALDAELAEPLVEGLPVIKAEVLHAISMEWAASLDDIFARRCMLTTEDLPWHERTEELAHAAGALMHWSEEECAEQHKIWMQAIKQHDRFTAKKIASLNAH